jgi:uncharacterized protein
VLLAGGQLAGIDSLVRQGIAIVTGFGMIALGLHQIYPGWLPLPKASPWHDRLSRQMMQLSWQTRWWTPLALGALWGLIPCGFLYVAQIKAAETTSWLGGASTMLAFGLGTMPVMVGLGAVMGSLSRDRRSQIYRLGGYLTVAIGAMLLFRSSDMVDFTGHGALLLLMSALIARPISPLWAAPLHYRRSLGVGAFGLSVLHLLHMLDHSFGWNLAAVEFMLPQYQVGVWAGLVALVLMTPAAVTSFDQAQRSLGRLWRWLHWLSVPALLACSLHVVLTGSHYLGGLEWGLTNRLLSGGMVCLTVGILLLRSGWARRWLGWGDRPGAAPTLTQASPTLDQGSADSPVASVPPAASSSRSTTVPPESNDTFSP